jgi:hypothetical protein
MRQVFPQDLAGRLLGQFKAYLFTEMSHKDRELAELAVGASSEGIASPETSETSPAAYYRLGEGSVERTPLVIWPPSEMAGY